MASQSVSVTVRGLRKDTKAQARVQAARRGRSMEAELRDLFERTYGEGSPASDEIVSASGEDARRPGEHFIDYLVRITRPGVDVTLPERTSSWSERPVFGAD